MVGRETDPILRGTVSLSEAMPVVKTLAVEIRGFSRQPQRVQEEILEFVAAYFDFLRDRKDEDKEKRFFNLWHTLGRSETIREIANSVALRSRETIRRRLLEVCDDI